jgi:hypothetical protein
VIPADLSAACNAAVELSGQALNLARCLSALDNSQPGNLSHVDLEHAVLRAIAKVRAYSADLTRRFDAPHSLEEL